MVIGLLVLEKIFKVFTNYWSGCHVGQDPSNKLSSPTTSKLHVKFGYLVTFGSVTEIVDGRTTEPDYTERSPGAFGSGELKRATYSSTQNYRTISLISYSSKVMLKVILIQAEEISVACWRTGWAQSLKKHHRTDLKTSESCVKSVKSTANINKICTMSPLISRKPLRRYGMQPYGPLCGSTISMQI